MSSASLASRLTRVAAGGILYSLLANAMIYAGQIVIARELTRTDYAIFSVVVSLVSLISMFADLGWTAHLVKRFAQAEVDRTDGRDMRGPLLGTAILLKLGLALIAATVGAGVTMLLYGPETALLVVIGLVTFFISSRILVFRTVMEAFVRAEGGIDKVLRLAALDAGTFAILLFAWSYLGMSLTAAVAIYSLCHLPGFILLVHYLRQVVEVRSIKPSFDRRVAKELFRDALPLSIGMSLFTIHNMSDALILDALSTPYQVSSFATSFRLMSGLIFLPTVIAGVVMPEFVRLMKQGEAERGTRLSSLALQSLLSGSIFIALLLSALAPILVSLVLGEQYADTWPLVIIFGWIFVPFTFATFMLELCIAVEKQRMFGYYTGVLAAITIIGDLLVAEPFGAIGVTGIKFVAIFSGCLVLARVCMTHPQLKVVLSSIAWGKNLQSLLVPLVALAVMYYAGMSTVLAGIVTAFLFIGWSLWSGLIDLDRLRVLGRSLMNR